MLKQTEIDPLSSALSYQTTRQDAHTETVAAGGVAEPASENLKLLARKLASRTPSERDKAQGILDSLPVPMILSLMAYQRKQRKARYIKIGIGLALYFLFFAVMSFSVHKSLPVNFWMFMTFGLSGAAFAKVQKSGAMALARRSDITAVGELVSALEMRDQEVQAVIRPTLIHLLPQLRANDEVLLNKDQRRLLRQFMEGTLLGRQSRHAHFAGDPALMLAILKALEQVGDASFLPVVHRWASGEQSGADPAVRRGAIDCVPFLEAIVARQKAGAELLRASSPQSSQSGTVLLRSASGPETAQSSELLRSAGGLDPDLTAADGCQRE